MVSATMAFMFTTGLLVLVTASGAFAVLARLAAVHWLAIGILVIAAALMLRTMLVMLALMLRMGRGGLRSRRSHNQERGNSQ
jgi:hypothetical protein